MRSEPVGQAPGPPTARRAQALFEEQRGQVLRRTDRMLACLLVCQWVVASLGSIAMSSSPWNGAARALHPDVVAAVVLGGIITGLPVALAILRTGSPVTRQSIAVAQALWSALLIHLAGGRIEMHFHVFGSLAILAFYRDWKVLVTASAVLAADHFLRGMFWPESVYGVANAEWWRFLEHGFWVAFESAFLIMACRDSVAEMWTTAERRAEIEALSANLEQQRAVLECQNDASLEGVLIVSPDLQPFSCNRRFTEIWGITPEDMARHSKEDLIAMACARVAAPEEFLARFAALVDDQEADQTDEIEFLDGRIVERYTAPVRSAGGVFVGRGWYFRDVTARVRAAGEVRALNQELEARSRALSDANRELEARLCELHRTQDQLMQADRLAGVGRLAAGIGHEINNPLTYVIANLDEIEASAGLSAEMGERVREALDGAHRVRRIVLDLKTMARTGEERRIPVDVAELLESAIRIAGNEIRHRGRLIRAYGAVPAVLGDPDRLCQVFLNLITNASQALTGPRAGGHEIRIRTSLLADRRVAVEIEDTGEGMGPERMARAFDPFFTTKPVGVGTGLGLSICHGIVANHGGQIMVESTVGVGTRFLVALLPAEPAALAPTEQPPASPTPLAPSARVLIVDDEPMLLASIKRKIAHHHQVETAEGAAKALALLARGTQFDVILCDVMMPDQTGIEFYERVAATGTGLEERIVFLTGGAFTPETGEFLQRCRNPVLEKPIDFRRLGETIDRVAGARDPDHARRAER
jgi:signal transduction histidine kinase/CheY-like chemotaxis protein